MCVMRSMFLRVHASVWQLCMKMMFQEIFNHNNKSDLCSYKNNKHFDFSLMAAAEQCISHAHAPHPHKYAPQINQPRMLIDMN